MVRPRAISMTRLTHAHRVYRGSFRASSLSCPLHRCRSIRLKPSTCGRQGPSVIFAKLRSIRVIPGVDGRHQLQTSYFIAPPSQSRIALRRIVTRSSVSLASSIVKGVTSASLQVERASLSSDLRYWLFMGWSVGFVRRRRTRCPSLGSTASNCTATLLSMPSSIWLECM